MRGQEIIVLLIYGQLKYNTEAVLCKAAQEPKLLPFLTWWVVLALWWKGLQREEEKREIEMKKCVRLLEETEKLGGE